MPVCSACGRDEPKNGYSKAQLGKKHARRCKQCVAAAKGVVAGAAVTLQPRTKAKLATSAEANADDDALLAAAMAENALSRESELQKDWRAAEKLLQAGTASIDERNRALSVKQAATRTVIPGQKLPVELTTALRAALQEIEAEDAAAGLAVNPSDGCETPFVNAPPSASSDPRVLRRQQIMLERMRRKQLENKERQKLALVDPAEAENCKRYNISEKQLRAVRRIGLRLPHECREQTAAKLEADAIEKEDVLFDDDMSLEDMLGALKEDKKFMTGR